MKPFFLLFVICSLVPGPSSTPVGIGTSEAAAISSVEKIRVDPDVEKRLRSFYERALVLYQKGDRKGTIILIEATTTPNWTLIDEAGVSHTRKETLRDVMTSAAPPSGETISFQIKNIRVQGDTAYVYAVQRSTKVEEDAMGEYGASGKRHRITRIDSTRDTWVKQLGVWKIRQSRFYASRLEVDGKLHRL